MAKHIEVELKNGKKIKVLEKEVQGLKEIGALKEKKIATKEEKVAKRTTK